jgi:hypothetical protein
MTFLNSKLTVRVYLQRITEHLTSQRIRLSELKDILKAGTFEHDMFLAGFSGF